MSRSSRHTLRWTAPTMPYFSWLLIALTALQPGLAREAFANEAIDTVKIITVNGGPATDSVIDVHPGDVISLSADIVRTGGDCALASGCPLNRDLEEFSWAADDS